METVFSGTVGGAMTGMMLGIPSIALSQAWTDREACPLGHRARLAPEVVRRLLEIGWSADTCLNVNFPDRPVDDVGELTLARQGVGMIRSIDVETPHRSARLHLSLARLPSGPARAGTGE